MKFTNGWNYVQKDNDRLQLTLRIGLVTVVDVFADCSDYKWGITLFNFRVGN